MKLHNSLLICLVMVAISLSFTHCDPKFEDCTKEDCTKNIPECKDYCDSIKNTEVDEDVVVDPCHFPNDKTVPWDSVIRWITQLELVFSENNIGAFGPGYRVKMQQLINVIDTFPNFRIYFGICPLNDQSTFLISAAPINDTCNSKLGINDSCLIVFDNFRFQNQNRDYVCDYSSTHCSGPGTAYYSTVKQATNYWKEIFTVSLTDSVWSFDPHSPPMGATQAIVPLAFSLNTSSFKEHIDTTVDSLGLYFGLQHRHTTETDTVAWRLKIILVTGDISVDQPHYVDFAAPCPRNCGKIDSLLKGD